METKLGEGKAKLDLISLALTISPPDCKVLTTSEIFKRHLVKLKQVKGNFLLYPELDIKGRLHYHGTVSKSEFFREDLDIFQKIGFVKVKPISNLTYWLKYCRKEWKLTKKILKIKKPIQPKDLLDIRVCRDILDYFLDKSDDKNVE